MASDQPVVPPVADVPEQGAAAEADAVSSSAQDTSREGDAVSALSAATSTAPSSAPDVAQPAEAKANLTYDEARGPAGFAQYIFSQMQQRGTADPGQLVEAIEACVTLKFEEFAQVITNFQERSRQREEQWRVKEREWKRLDEAHKRLETTLRAELADKVEQEKGEAAQRDIEEAVEQERARWQSAMDTLSRDHREKLARAEARAQRLSDEVDAAELRREHRSDVARVSDLQSEMQSDLPEKIKELKHKYRLLEQEVEAQKEELARERDEISARWEQEAENLGVQHEEELTEYRDWVDELKQTQREEQEAWQSARAEEEEAAAAAAQREQRLSRRLRELGQDPQVVAATSPTGPEAPPGTLAYELGVPSGGDFSGDDDNEVAGPDKDPDAAAAGAGQEELDRLREDHEALQREKDDVTAQLNRLRGIAEELKYNMEKAEERRAAAGQQDLEQIREAMMTSVRDEITRLEASKRHAEERRLQAENERAVTAKEKTILQAENSKLMQQVSAMEQKSQTQAAQLTALRDMAQKLQQSIKDDEAGLVAQLNALRAEATAQQLEREEAEAAAEAHFEAQRAAAIKNTRAVVEKLDAALAAAKRDKAELEEKLLHHPGEGGEGSALAGSTLVAAVAELAEYRDAVVQALDAYDEGFAQARRAAALAGEPDTLGELKQLVESDCTAIEALHRRTVEAAQKQAQASSGSSSNGSGDTAEQRQQLAAKLARIGGELTKIRGIQRRLSLDDALLAALRERRRPQQPQSEGEEEKPQSEGEEEQPPSEGEEEREEQQDSDDSGSGGSDTENPPQTAGVKIASRRRIGGFEVTPLVAALVVTLVFCLAATAAEGHRYSLWRVANATTRAMMAENQYYTCVGVPQPAYFADWLLKTLGVREWDARDYM